VDDSLSWDFIPWLRSITSLPIWLKVRGAAAGPARSLPRAAEQRRRGSPRPVGGAQQAPWRLRGAHTSAGCARPPALPPRPQGVLAPEDAALAVQHGVEAIVVSNHGGRQLDYAPAAIDMLPAICAAVAGRAEVWVDGGIRRGTDVLKALALGARGVLLGRPALYGLALGGQQGVEKVIGTLGRELEMAMALAGCDSLAGVSRRLLLGPAGAGGGGCCGGACCPMEPPGGGMGSRL
jgi:hypothetical protein